MLCFPSGEDRGGGGAVERDRSLSTSPLKWSKDLSEQVLEFLDGQASVFDDPSHGEGVDGGCARDDNDPLAIGHRDVFTLADHPQARLRKRLDGPAVGNTWESWYGYTGTSTKRVVSSFVSSLQFDPVLHPNLLAQQLPIAVRTFASNFWHARSDSTCGMEMMSNSLPAVLLLRNDVQPVEVTRPRCR